MKITFQVGDRRLQFSRDPFLGSAVIEGEGVRLRLASPLDPRTHFALSKVRVWSAEIAGHHVRIEKRRPWLLAGFRSQDYAIFVDETLVATGSGL